MTVTGADVLPSAGRRLYGYVDESGLGDAQWLLGLLSFFF